MKTLLTKLFNIGNKVGKIKKSGQNPQFRQFYSTLEDYLTELRPLWKEYGIYVFFTVEEDDFIQINICNLEDGEVLTTKKKIFYGGRNPIHDFGSNVTYFKRYLISMTHNLGGELDIDGSDLSDNKKDIEDIKKKIVFYKNNQKTELLNMFKKIFNVNELKDIENCDAKTIASMKKYLTTNKDNKNG